MSFGGQRLLTLVLKGINLLSKQSGDRHIDLQRNINKMKLSFFRTLPFRLVQGARPSSSLVRQSGQSIGDDALSCNIGCVFPLLASMREWRTMQILQNFVDCISQHIPERMFLFAETRVAAMLTSWSPSVTVQTSIDAAVEACCLSLGREIGPAEAALVPTSTAPCAGHLDSRAAYAFSDDPDLSFLAQIQELRTNWYVTAGDVAAMSKVENRQQTCTFPLSAATACIISHLSRPDDMHNLHAQIRRHLCTCIAKGVTIKYFSYLCGDRRQRQPP